MLKVLSVSSDTLRRLAKSAEDAYPMESCALLLGNAGYVTDTVQDIILLKNKDQSKYSFSVHSMDLFYAYQKASKSGLSVIGIFHSHPSLPSPSKKDRKFMELNPIVWLIYSTLNHEYSAFLYSEGIMPVQIRYIQGNRRSTSLGNNTTSLTF
jgi:[CysO sulfur-carrier protein]-S-L-cysteine hydrolase